MTHWASFQTSVHPLRPSAISIKASLSKKFAVLGSLICIIKIHILNQFFRALQQKVTLLKLLLMSYSQANDQKNRRKTTRRTYWWTLLMLLLKPYLEHNTGGRSRPCAENTAVTIRVWSPIINLKKRYIMVLNVSRLCSVHKMRVQIL